MKAFHSYILETIGATEIVKTELIQSLWSNYGQIARLFLKGAKQSTVVVKHIQFPKNYQHPRGWNTNISHKRKVQSYEIENNWYQHWSGSCGDSCRTPQLLGYQEIETEKLLILEDLDANGFPERKEALTIDQSKVVLKWLAHFHATFMHIKPEGLWPIGTYWHLATRQDEWNIMPKSTLKEKATWLDQQLNNCLYQTIVHGDAKVANFCFSSDFQSVAAVDFQYVGGGCGIKDVVYFLGSSLTADECQIHESELLDFYFYELSTALNVNQKEINSQAVISEYRTLYAIAWTDFTRFLVGWSPNHKKLNTYSALQMKKALKQNFKAQS